MGKSPHPAGTQSFALSEKETILNGNRHAGSAFNNDGGENDEKNTSCCKEEIPEGVPGNSSLSDSAAFFPVGDGDG